MPRVINNAHSQLKDILPWSFDTIVFERTTPVYQTRHGAPHGNCLAACVASILDKRIEDVDVDVASCSSYEVLLRKLGQKAKCKIYKIPHEAIVDGVVRSAERYCIVSVCTCVFNNDPCHPDSTWHSVVCEIKEDGKLSLVFDPNRDDQRTKLQQFKAVGPLFVVKANAGN